MPLILDVPPTNRKKTGEVTKAINSVPRFAIVDCEILQKLIWVGNYSQKGSYKMEEYYRWLKIAKGKYKRSLLPWFELNLNYWNKYLFSGANGTAIYK